MLVHFYFSLRPSCCLSSHACSLLPSIVVLNPAFHFSRDGSRRTKIAKEEIVDDHQEYRKGCKREHPFLVGITDNIP